MGIKIGFSTSIHFWNPEKVIKIADKYNTGVELMNLRWHDLKDYNKWFAHNNNAKLFGIHGSFFSADKKYFKKIIFSSRGLDKKLIELLFLLISGTPENNKAGQISEAKKCYLNCHPDSIVKAGTKVLVEYIPKEIAYLDTTDINELARKYSIKKTMDISHIGADGLDLVEKLNEIDPDVIHFSDTKMGQDLHLVPGEGELTLNTLLQAIKAKDKEIYIIIELAPALFGVEKRLKNSLNFIKNCLE